MNSATVVLAVIMRFFVIRLLISNARAWPTCGNVRKDASALDPVTDAAIRSLTREMMRTELLRFNGAVERSPEIDAWMERHAGELGAVARQWFEVMRQCGDEVRELLHDGCPVASLGDAPFGYVNVFTSHVNVGFFQGASLPDPARLLQGTGKFMRHVKLKPATPTNSDALRSLIAAAYSDIKQRVENT
jgi:hypothetical protein